MYEALTKGNFMRRLLVAAAIALSSSSAFALQTTVQKGTKLGTGCVGPVVSVAPKLATCTIAGSKTRIWCPNGDIFDDGDGRSAVALVRSLCNLTQVP
jgi:hypothetical protein